MRSPAELLPDLSVPAMQPLPYGLMLLSDMINCSVHSLAILFAQLMCEVINADLVLREQNAYQISVPDTEKKRFERWLSLADMVANQYEWSAVHDRIKIFRRKLGKEIVWDEYASEIRVLKETIESGLGRELIYRYPREKGSVLMQWQSDWATVLRNFPSAKLDIIAGVDCWALSHSTASVFHFMRVLEHGLAALAKELEKSFDIQNWQNIINEIEAEIRSRGKLLPRGAEKNETLQFLSEAAKEFVYFKDGWRNYVAHNRVTYDEHQARSAMEHVRSFMTVLSSKLSEDVPPA